VIAHVVLMKPKPSLSADDRRAFIAAFRRALRDIPSVRNVRVGKRLGIGASYESLTPDTANYLAVIDFDDVVGLQAYLQHPAHRELGARFYDAIESAIVCDYSVGGAEVLDEI
jgi:Stress responsive A/B Barrel Domain